MWEELKGFTGSAWESVSESAEKYVDAYANNVTQQEINRNPDLLAQAEPEKGTRTDGSTITESKTTNTQQAANTQAQLINGVSNNALLLGGLGFLGLILVLKVGV